MAKAAFRLIFVTSLCVGLTGCVEVPIHFAGLLLVDGLKQAFPPKVSSVNPYQLAQADRERCRDLTRKGVEVTEPLRIAIPTNEGDVQMFKGTIWRLHAEGERASQREAEAEGTLAITERSVLLVPPPGTAGVRIPYEAVLTVELSPINPYSMTVKSCMGRFETFYFWRREPNAVDPVAAAVAATHLKARVVAFQTTTLKVADTPR